MPPGADKEFLNANMQDKIAYLSSVDPEFQKASPQEKTAYIQHISMQMQPAGQSEVEKAAPPKDYGFTGGNMLRGLGEGAKGIFTGGYGLAKDIATNPNWVIGPDSTYDKFIDRPATAEAEKAKSLWNSGHGVQAAGHALAGALPMVGPWAAHLGEKAGTGDVGGALSEGAGAAATAYALPKIRGAARDAVYSEMPPTGKGPQLTTFAKKAAQVGGGAAGAALAPGNLGYEGAVGGYLAGPEVLKKAVGAPELGSIKNPGPYSKMPLRVPRSPAMEAEAEAPASTPQSAPSNRRMAPPLRPLIGSPEDWQAYDAQKAILKPEASDAGLYSAARGAVSRIPDYQQRIGGKLRPFGRPVDLQEDVVPPPRKVSSDE